MGLQDLLSKIAKSKASAGGNYIRDGKYLLMLEKMSIEALFKGDTFIAELRVIEAANDPMARDEKGAQVEANAVGTTVTFLQQFKEHPLTAFGNTKAFLLALTGDKEEDVNEDEFVTALQGSVGKDQPLRGCLIRAETYRKPTKDKSKILTLPRWSSVPQTEEEVMKRRKELDSKTPVEKPAA